MKRRDGIVLAVTIAVGLGVFIVCEFPGVEVRMTRTTELVGTNDEAVSLLLNGAPLEKIVEAIRRSGKSVDEIRWVNGPLLNQAVLEHRLDVAKWLLKNGASPNGVNRWSVPMDHAVTLGDANMVRLFVNCGADPNFKIGGGDMTPKLRAISLGNKDVIDAISVGASVSVHRPS